ncbi:hypothetical protein Y032_0039g163 [Ancylostoma ceylanicum]|nr:hypothetical protein Y032_0039g163 [Ancylostoma ceylanicum]
MRHGRHAAALPDGVRLFWLFFLHLFLLLMVIQPKSDDIYRRRKVEASEVGRLDAQREMMDVLTIDYRYPDSYCHGDQCSAAVGVQRRC